LISCQELASGGETFGSRPVPWKDSCGDTSHIDNFSDVFGNLYRHLFHVLPGNEFGFLHDAFEKLVVEEWKGLEPAPRSILRVPAPGFYMNPEQEIELVLRVLSTGPTDEEIFHLEHEDVNPRKVEQEPEEEPEQEPEEKPEEEPEQKPEEEPVPLPVPVGGNLSSLTARSVSFKKFRTHETTSSAPQQNGRLERHHLRNAEA
jgi:hypothetical protein